MLVVDRDYDSSGEDGQHNYSDMDEDDLEEDSVPAEYGDEESYCKPPPHSLTCVLYRLAPTTAVVYAGPLTSRPGHRIEHRVGA